MLSVGGAPFVSAHDGHDHGAPPTPVSTSIAPRFEASSETSELVGILRGGKVILHLDRFVGNGPVTDAEIDVETPAGTVKAKNLGNGAYSIDAPWAARSGQFDLIATITSAGELDVVTGTLKIPELVQGASKPGATDLAQRLDDGVIFVPKASQKILDLRNEMTATGEHARRITLPGRLIADPNASGVVQAAVAGRLSPPPGGFPRLGARIKAGDVLAIVQPSIPAADLTTQAQQARELDQQISLVTRRLERFRQITGSVTRSQVEDAELELAGLYARRASIDKFPKEPEKLIAPVDGVIAASNVTNGQIAEPAAILFQIADPARIWVEALSYAGAVQPGAASVQLADGRNIPLAFEGTGFAAVNQAVPVHFSIGEATRGLRLGQLVTVLVETDQVETGIAVPRASVLRAANGQSIVFEQTNAERFVPREVRVRPLDGARSLILSGIDPGKRIVTQGAELLNQIR